MFVFNSLVVSAVDNGPLPHYTAYAGVSITLLDVNEFKPTFPKLIYIEYVAPDEPSGSTVVEAEAADRDAGAYGVVRYSLAPMPDSEGGAFDIDSATGRV